MKEDFFNVGYTAYVHNNENEKQRWTSSWKNKMWEHRFLITISSIILMCLSMNFFLIYRFMRIIEISFK